MSVEVQLPRDVISDHQWRSYTGQVVQEFLAPGFDYSNPPTVQAHLLRDGFSNPRHDSLTKAERFAPAGALSIVHGQAVVTGVGTTARFRKPLELIPPRPTRSRPPVGILTDDVIGFYTSVGEDLAANRASRFWQYLDIYLRRALPDDMGKYMPLDQARYEEQRNVLGGAALPSEIHFFLSAVAAATSKSKTVQNFSRNQQLKVYHDLAVWEAGRTMMHTIPFRKQTKTVLDKAVQDATLRHRPGGWVLAGPDGGSLLPKGRGDDWDGTPVLRCPAHQPVRNILHATINEAAERGII